MNFPKIVWVGSLAFHRFSNIAGLLIYDEHTHETESNYWGLVLSIVKAKGATLTCQLMGSRFDPCCQQGNAGANVGQVHFTSLLCWSPCLLT